MNRETLSTSEKGNQGSVALVMHQLQHKYFGGRKNLEEMCSLKSLIGMDSLDLTPLGPKFDWRLNYLNLNDGQAQNLLKQTIS